MVQYGVVFSFSMHIWKLCQKLFSASEGTTTRRREKEEQNKLNFINNFSIQLHVNIYVLWMWGSLLFCLNIFVNLVVCVELYLLSSCNKSLQSDSLQIKLILILFLDDQILPSYVFTFILYISTLLQLLMNNCKKKLPEDWSLFDSFVDIHQFYLILN